MRTQKYLYVWLRLHLIFVRCHFQYTNIINWVHMNVIQPVYRHRKNVTKVNVGVIL